MSRLSGSLGRDTDAVCGSIIIESGCKACLPRGDDENTKMLMTIADKTMRAALAGREMLISQPTGVGVGVVDAAWSAMMNEGSSGEGEQDNEQ